MNLRLILTQWLGYVLFLTGIGIGLTLSAFMTWAELESNLDITLPDAKGLRLSCPLMLSYNETGIVRANIVNETDKEVKPVVKASFGQKNSLKQLQISETHLLGPRETQSLQWSVDASQAAFGRIIPISIIQSPYNRNPPRWGACGVLLFSLFGLNGAYSLFIIIASSLLLILTGVRLTSLALTAGRDASKNIRQAGALLAILTVLAIVFSLIRWWGLTILLITLSVITVLSIVVEIPLPHRKVD